MSRIHYRLALLTSCLICLTNAASANDSTGYVATGGVTYLKNPHVRMASENLFISQERIRVRYEFVNDAPQSVTETVLFPMPVINYAETRDGDFADTAGLVESFKVLVNGQSIKPTLHARGFWKEKDITTALTECGFSDREIVFPYFNDEPDGQWRHRVDTCFEKMLKQGIISETEESDERRIWASQIIYSWPQTFPSKKTLLVEHEYQPLVGGSVAGIARGNSEYAKEMQRAYCFDKTFWQKMARGNKTYPSYTALGYVLTTGANWAKPIGRFKLTIDKPKDTLMSLCWDSSLKKVSETRFEATKTNFKPTRDIDIIFAIAADPQ